MSQPIITAPVVDDSKQLTVPWRLYVGTIVTAVNINGLIALSSPVGLSNVTGVSTATLTNSPVAGNPSKWIPIDDNGTTRYIPAW